MLTNTVVLAPVYFILAGTKSHEVLWLLIFFVRIIFLVGIIITVWSMSRLKLQQLVFHLSLHFVSFFYSCGLTQSEHGKVPVKQKLEGSNSCSCCIIKDQKHTAGWKASKENSSTSRRLWPQRSGLRDISRWSGVKPQLFGDKSIARHYLTIPHHTVGAGSFSDVIGKTDVWRDEAMAVADLGCMGHWL